jgi:hypothetical protein
MDHSVFNSLHTPTRVKELCRQQSRLATLTGLPAKVEQRSRIRIQHNAEDVREEGMARQPSRLATLSSSSCCKATTGQIK